MTRAELICPTQVASRLIQRTAVGATHVLWPHGTTSIEPTQITFVYQLPEVKRSGRRSPADPGRIAMSNARRPRALKGDSHGCHHAIDYCSYHSAARRRLVLRPRPCCIHYTDEGGVQVHRAIRRVL